MSQTRGPNPDQGHKQAGQDVNQPGQQQQRQQAPDQGESRKQQDQAGSTQRQDPRPATPDETVDRSQRNRRQGNEETVDPTIDRTAQTSGEDVG
jgi:hypothetical protein